MSKILMKRMIDKTQPVIKKCVSKLNNNNNTVITFFLKKIIL